ncbi:MAG: NrdH-redoxin [Verrucomicrobia bacterium]|nr:MAG: NrdH-redoxin [Verrucomicrobiota bacterium]
MTPTLYVKHRCPWCAEAIAWLDQRKIKYHLVDVLADATAYKRMQKISGQSRTPTLELANGAVLADFDVSQLEGFLENNPL